MRVAAFVAVLLAAQPAFGQVRYAKDSLALIGASGEVFASVSVEAPESGDCVVRADFVLAMVTHTLRGVGLTPVGGQRHDYSANLRVRLLVMDASASGSGLVRGCIASVDALLTSARPKGDLVVSDHTGLKFGPPEGFVTEVLDFTTTMVSEIADEIVTAGDAVNELLRAWEGEVPAPADQR